MTSSLGSARLAGKAAVITGGRAVSFTESALVTGHALVVDGELSVQCQFSLALSGSPRSHGR